MDGAMYLVVETIGGETPIVFPSFLEHHRIAKLLNMKVISAGFVKIVEGQVKSFGASVTLGLRARDEDEELLKRLLTKEV